MKPPALIVAVVLGIYSAANYAEPPRLDSNAEVERIYSELKDATQDVEQMRIEREQLISQLQTIEKQYGAAAGTLHELAVDIHDKRQRLKQIDSEIETHQAELKKQQQDLGQQIKAAFVMGKKDQLKLLLNQQNPALTSRMQVYYRYLSSGRVKKLQALKENIAALERLKLQKNQEHAALENNLVSQKNVQIGLNSTKQQRDELLAKLNREFQEKSRQLGALDQSVAESQALIAKLEKQALARQAALRAAKPPQQQQTNDSADNSNSDGKAFAQLKGHLSWPLRGEIIQKFSNSTSDARSGGVLIAAKEGMDIKAVADGRVVFADWLRGYGLLIILDHGHSYMTLYAFNQSLYKKVGDVVKAGTVIAAVGKSGGREESGLYFGIRNNGKPVDPTHWCKK